MHIGQEYYGQNRFIISMRRHQVFAELIEGAPRMAAPCSTTGLTGAKTKTSSKGDTQVDTATGEALR
jgi:hypothetical protein